MLCRAYKHIVFAKLKGDHRVARPQVGWQVLVVIGDEEAHAAVALVVNSQLQKTERSTKRVRTVTNVTNYTSDLSARLPVTLPGLSEVT